MRERGEHIRNEGFRASERSKGNYNSRRGSESDNRRPRRRDDDGGERRPRRFDKERQDERPVSDDERERRNRVARDRRMMSDVDNRDRKGRYDDDFDQEFRHSETFAKRILRDRKPTLSADKEVPIIHGRRKSWKRRDLDEPADQNPQDNNDNE